MGYRYFFTTILSIMRLRIGVTERGLKSLAVLGLVTFGTEVMMLSFHCGGTYEKASD